VVRRLEYSALINDPESTIRGLLSFLNEPYEPACLEPIRIRINSSNVPSDFESSDPATDPRVVEEARTLEDELVRNRGPLEPSHAIAAEIESAFELRIYRIRNLESNHAKCLDRAANLQKELDELKADLLLANSTKELTGTNSRVRQSKLRAALTRLRRRH
jgi:hypothetical protein